MENQNTELKREVYYFLVPADPIASRYIQYKVNCLYVYIYAIISMTI